ncbi:MAG: hypothetical protein IJJ44_09780 [Solobacterium sp.]|nr:hypothetical protein [Solobacterium sp.]
MPGVFAVTIEILICLCAVWVMLFLSTFLHEFGHAIGYMISTGDRHWHIRVGSGKKLLETKRLTVKLMVFDGYFEPAENRIDSKGKLISTLAGGPVVSLVLVIVLLFLRCGGTSFNSGIIASSAIEFFINFALFCNVFILISSILPGHYFFGEIKGKETDGMKIINAMKGRDYNR